MTALDIVTIGNVAENNSTPPHYFYKAAENLGISVKAINSVPHNYQTMRRWWNLKRLILGKGLGGFQYSSQGCCALEKCMLPQLESPALLTFSQHMPLLPAALHQKDLYVYVDATLAGFNKGIGLDFEVPSDIKTYALEREQKLYHSAKLIFTRSAWAKESMVIDHGIDPKKIFVVYPGANLGDVNTFVAPETDGLVLGFVAKDWKRKGFEYLLQLAEYIQDSGIQTTVKVIGELPPELASHPQVEYLGFIDKKNRTEDFVRALQSCHFGTLFSDKESLGISSLEFLRCGVPIIGFDHQGITDTLNSEASVALKFNEAIDIAAATILEKFQSNYTQLRMHAEALSPKLTWDRAVQEIIALIKGQEIDVFSIKKHFQK